jgi:putative FmdB family regulatory protein
MPVYEYICVRCSKPFEELVLGPEEIRCPACSSLHVEKRYSTFATANSLRSHSTAMSNEAMSNTLPGCGTCGDPRGPGSCSLN